MAPKMTQHVPRNVENRPQKGQKNDSKMIKTTTSKINLLKNVPRAMLSPSGLWRSILGLFLSVFWLLPGTLLDHFLASVWHSEAGVPVLSPCLCDVLAVDFEVAFATFYLFPGTPFSLMIFYS